MPARMYIFINILTDQALEADPHNIHTIRPYHKARNEMEMQIFPLMGDNFRQLC